MKFRTILRARRKESAVPIYVVMPFSGTPSARWEFTRGFDVSQNAYQAMDLHSFERARVEQRLNARSA
jgi:hypothetical protein